MEDKLDIIAKQLVEEKSEDVIKLYNSLTDIDKFYLNKFHNMNFKTFKTYSDEELWFESSRKGYIKTVQHFIDKGIDVNLQSKYGSTALIIASFYGKNDVVKLLLQHPNIDVNLQDSYRNSPLIYASFRGDVEIVKNLLQHKDIDISLKNDKGETALNLAETDEIKELIKNHGR